MKRVSKPSLKSIEAASSASGSVSGDSGVQSTGSKRVSPHITTTIVPCDLFMFVTIFAFESPSAAPEVQKCGQCKAAKAGDE